MTSGASISSNRSRNAGQMRQLTRQHGVELGADHGAAADELDDVRGVELSEREQRADHGRTGGVVAPHDVQRDARQGYASRAVTRCSPA